MVGEDLELLITAVVAADDEQQARAACAGLLRQVGGRVVRAFDCSDEEPGCWSVTISGISDERATQNVAGALARAVRTCVRRLGDEFPTPRVACEPPTAWTVLDDPALLDGLVPGAERLLVEAWAGGDPQHHQHDVPEPTATVRTESARTGTGRDDVGQAEARQPGAGHARSVRAASGQDQSAQDQSGQAEPGRPEAGEAAGLRQAGTAPDETGPAGAGRAEPGPDGTGQPATGRPGTGQSGGRQAGAGPDGTGQAPPAPVSRLALRVDVAADRSAGAEWQARAVASRVTRNGKITRVAPQGHLLSVHIDLGSSVDSPTVALRGAVASLGRSGWSDVEWSGGAGTTRWSATPVPPAGITALELTATPASAFVWTVPD